VWVAISSTDQQERNPLRCTRPGGGGRLLDSAAPRRRPRLLSKGGSAPHALMATSPRAIGGNPSAPTRPPHAVGWGPRTPPPRTTPRLPAVRARPPVVGMSVSRPRLCVYGLTKPAGLRAASGPKCLGGVLAPHVQGNMRPLQCIPLLQLGVANRAGCPRSRAPVRQDRRAEPHHTPVALPRKRPGCGYAKGAPGGYLREEPAGGAIVAEGTPSPAGAPCRPTVSGAGGPRTSPQGVDRTCPLLVV
jgi:hypothetical protein